MEVLTMNGNKYRSSYKTGTNWNISRTRRRNFKQKTGMEKGVIITAFDECFGELFDHEIIKGILQNFNWNPQLSLNALVEMADLQSKDKERVKVLERKLKINGQQPSSNNTNDSSNSVNKSNKLSFAELSKINTSKKVLNVPKVNQVDTVSNDNLDQSKILLSTISALIDRNVKCLVIMRGLPGSGKSTLALKIATPSGLVLSTDDFFYVGNEYRYDFLKISEAHSWNQDRCRNYMGKNINPIVIDNTNMELWEMKPYVEFAVKYRYKVYFVEPNTPWKYKPYELARRTKHGVPKGKIENMLSRFQKDVKFSDFEKSNVNNLVPEKKSPISIDRGKNDNNINGISKDEQSNLLKKNITLKVNDNNSTIIEVQSPIKDSINQYKETNNSSQFLINSRESTPGQVDDCKFSEIVKALGDEVKKQINKDNANKLTVSETTDPEDLKMYQFCSNIEDKIGNSISTLIRPQFMSDAIYSRDNNDVLESISESLGNLKISRLPELDPVTEEMSDELSRSSFVDANSTTDLIELKQSDSFSCSSQDADLEADSKSKNEFEDDLPNEISSTPLETNKSVVEIEKNQSVEPAVEDWMADDDYETKVLKMKKTGAVPKRHRFRPNAAPVDQESKSNSNDINKAAQILSKEMAKEKEVEVNADFYDWTANNDLSSWQEEDNSNKNLNQVKEKRNRVRSKISTNENEKISVCENSKPSMCDQCCETDFNDILSNKNLKVLYAEKDRFKNLSLCLPTSDGPITRGVLYLDKSTMTNDPIDEESKKSNLLENLKAFFPKLREEDLKDLLEKCNGDINWATNILMEDGNEVSSSPVDMTSSTSSMSPENVNSDKDSNSQCDDSSQCDTNSLGDRTSTPDNQYFKKKKRKAKFKNVPITSVLDVKMKRDSEKMKDVKKDQKVNLENFTVLSSVVEKSENQEKSADESNASSPVKLDSLSLELDPLFAYQLINLFGPVGNLNMNHDFTSEERGITLPLSLCKEIHAHWNATLESKMDQDEKLIQEYTSSDALIAYQLQEEDRLNNTTFNPKNHFLESFDCPQLPTNLKEIQDLEKALQISIGKNTAGSSNMSYKLSEQKLCETFSHVDASSVKDILISCNGKSDEASAQLLLKFGPKPQLNGESTDRRPLEMFGQETESNQLDDNKSYCQYDDIEEEKQKIDETYNMYYSLRKELLEKARTTPSGQYKSYISSHYAQKATICTEKLKELNNDLGKVYLNSKHKSGDPNTLDLHMLRVTSAVNTAKSFLEERKRALEASGKPKISLTLITGWGKHSSRQVGILKPALKNFLSEEGFIYSEVDENPGILIVTIKNN